MTTGNTTLLGLALPVEGELDGTWGDVVNDSLTSLVDSAVAGTTTLSADADVTLTDTALAANQARQAVLLWTASNGASTRNITAPARSKPYIVINAGTGSIVLRGAGPTTGVTIIAGEKCLAAWNGSDFVKVSSSVATALTGTLPVANGGTGATTLTANNVILGNGTSAPLFVAPGTTGNVLTSDGTTWGSSPGATGDVTLAGTQTLTNKTIAFADNTLTGVAGTTATQTLTNKTIAFADNTLTDVAGTTATQTLTNKTVTNLVFDGDYTEEVFTITDGASVDLDPSNGTVQLWTLGASRSPTDTSFASGQSMTLMVDDGSDYAITWPSVVWKTDGGSAPTLNTSGYTVIQLWKVSTVLYGARVGDA